MVFTATQHNLLPPKFIINNLATLVRKFFIYRMLMGNFHIRNRLQDIDVVFSCIEKVLRPREGKLYQAFLYWVAGITCTPKHEHQWTTSETDERVNWTRARNTSTIWMDSRFDMTVTLTFGIVWIDLNYIIPAAMTGINRYIFLIYFINIVKEGGGLL